MICVSGWISDTEFVSDILTTVPVSAYKPFNSLIELVKQSVLPRSYSVPMYIVREFALK